MLATLRRAAAAMALVTGAAATATPAEAADACISKQAQDAISACPGGTLAQSNGKKPAMSFKSAPTGVNLKKGEQQTKPGDPAASMGAAQRDERRNRLAPKVRQLLVTEIQGLESLYASTPKSSPDRPKLMRRLAEGYVELEAAAFRDKTENGMKADEAKAKGGSPDQFRGEAEKANKILEAARAAAIKYYTALKDQYPKWCQNTNANDPAKSTGCTDEVLYYLAYEYEQGNKLDDARKVYLELIQSWPQSKFIPNAYLAFGELFFNEAQGDPSKWALAEQSYGEVIKYPAPENKVWGYAHYKLGYVYWNKGDFARAMSEFKKTIEYGVQYASLPNAEQLAVSARRDIIPIYALAGDPKRAHDFLKPLSGDSGGSTEKTFKMMDDLGQNYLDTGHYPEGIALYTDLMARDRGPKYCVYQGHIAEATLAMKSGNKEQIMGELKKQLDVRNGFLKTQHPEAAKLKCDNITADLMTETAMAWHLEAVGSGGVRGTGDKKTMALAAQLYEDVVKTFKQEDFAKFEFPRIVKEDWPSIFKIKYAMADLLYFNKDWAKCGPAFDSVVAEDPNGPQAAEAAYAAVLCYQNIYTEQHQGGKALKSSGNLPSSAKGDKDKGKDKSKLLAPKEFTEGQKGMITAFNRYICYIKPAAGDKEANDNYVEVKFARGRTYFEAQHWEEAALAFREVAMNYADKDVGIYAAQFYLESLNVLGSGVDPTHPACYDDMAADVPKFIDLFCKGDKAKQNAEQCGILNRIQRDIERLQAEELIKKADKTGGVESYKMYEKGAQLYLDMWKKYSEAACEAKQTASCDRAEEILYNSARAFQAARLIAKSIAVRKILIDPKYNLHNTEAAKKAIYEIGGNYQAIAVYDEASSWYERYAAANKGAEKAPEALQDAVVLRLGLGQEDQAIKDADLFNRNYGTSKPAQTAAIAFAIGAHYIEKEDWGEARKRLTSAMSQIDKNATVDVQIQAHAMLGRVFVKLNSATNATGEYNKVRGLWKDPAAVVKKIQESGGDDRKIGKALTAVGEALFFFAEQQRKEVDKIRFPEYKGSGTKEDVLKHVNGKVGDWIKKKAPAIEAAEKEYIKILDLQPLPPPRWVIAAGSRVGQMWGKFVAEFRAAPIPKEWKGNGIVPGTADLSYAELRGEYYAKLDEASEPQKQRAKVAFKKCLDYSVKYQYFDEYSRKCEEWLSKNYGAEYHLIDEFRGSPSRVNSGLNEQTQPINIDGSAYQAEAPAPPPDEKPAAAATPAPADKADDKKGQSKEKSALDRAKRK
ncbi:TPR domain protein [Minicystis rosea]|nr:TPR domain protein [Minicystis rosea]